VPEPIAAADSAPEKNSVDELVKSITSEAAAGIRARFKETAAKSRQAEQSVEAGREFVRAYVEFIHYVERLHNTLAAPADSHSESADSAHKH